MNNGIEIKPLKRFCAKTRAIQNGWAFNLTIDDLVTLWEDQLAKCYYTGVDLTYAGDRRPEAMSIDRIDSTNGYTRDNIVLCCRRINEMKREMSINDLRRWCELLLINTEETNV